MDFIQDISSPYLAAILLGLVFVLDPCALLSNIAAIGYISKDYKNRRQVIRNYTYFALGRVLTLGILGAILVVLFRKSILLFNLQNFLSEYSEITMGVFFIVIGILLIFADKITFLHVHLPTQRIERQKRHIALQSFILGSLISLILCPANIVIFFGILIPLSIGSSAGVFLPSVFSVASTLPIILVMFIMALSVNNIDKIFRFTDKIGKYLVRISGVLFVLVGIYICIEHLFLHLH